MSIASRNRPEPGVAPSSALPRRSPLPRRSALPRRSRLWAVLPLPAGKALGILVLAVMVLLASVVLMEWPVLRHTHGNVLYPVDAAFMNITVARNLAFYQVWGVSKYAFASAASSLLYPLVLAPVFFIFGAHLVIPLIVNFLAAAYFLLMVQRALIRYGVSPGRQLVVLLGVMVLTLLPLLVVGGMEYVLQLLFGWLFLDALVLGSGLGSAAGTGSGSGLVLGMGSATGLGSAAGLGLSRQAYVYGLLAVAARYEDIVVIGVACILVGLVKNWKTAGKLALFGASPIVVFGVISLFKKSYFLPNSLLVGPFPVGALVLTAVAVAAAVWLVVRYARESPGGADGYEADPAPRKRRPGVWFAGAIFMLLAVPFSVRNGAVLAHFRRDCDRVYDGQFPAADFIHLYYYKATVGVNRPGAASYFSEGRKLDYTGIASRDVIQKKYQHLWSPRWADSLSHLDGIRVAIVADPWFRPGQMPRWTRIASWVVAGGGSGGGSDPGSSSGSGGGSGSGGRSGSGDGGGSDPEGGGGPGGGPAGSGRPDAGGGRTGDGGSDATARQTITFYAINQYDTSRLRKNLHEYQRRLPATVAVSYY